MYRLKRFELPFFEINIRQKNAEQQIERNKSQKYKRSRKSEVQTHKKSSNTQKHKSNTIKICAQLVSIVLSKILKRKSDTARTLSLIWFWLIQSCIRAKRQGVIVNFKFSEASITSSCAQAVAYM